MPQVHGQLLFAVVKLVCFFFIYVVSFPLHAKNEICDGVIIYQDDLELTDTEERMVCGDQKLRAWKKIPAYEAKFFFQGFLQSRGFLSPEFKITDDVLHVYPGERAEVEKISVSARNEKLQDEIDDELERLFEEKVLSTSTLNAIEAEARTQIRNRGYPCSDVRSEANIHEEKVSVFLDDQAKFEFGKIEKEEIPGLRKNALDRYYAFESNQTFDQRLLKLTEKRMTRAEVVQGTYFLENCSDESFSLSQKFILGPPRTIRFGVGASTELGPMARVRWSHNRYKSMASILSANLQASFRTQSLTLTADSFLWHHRPRRSLYSEFEILRESQLEYEQSVLRLRPHLKWTRDSEGFHKLYTLGPTYEAGTFRSTENENTRSFSTGIIEGGLVWTSHDYEFFDLHPQNGEVYNFSFDFRLPSMGFFHELLKLNSSIVKLSRFTSSGRGIIVGGARLNLGTTWISREISSRGLPPTVKFFGGGSDDLRGFQLQTLPDNQGLGALTKVGVKLELRRTYFFRESIEAFTFYDLAWFGDKSWDIDPSLYSSPGVGLRWISPIGLVQGFVARGFKTKPFKDFGNLYYIGIGGVF